MPKLPRITLRKNKVDAVKRFHPWIFSGAILKSDAGVQDGDLVEVYSEGGEYLATGFYSPNNIAIKVLSFKPVADLQELFLEKFQNAFALRAQLGLAGSSSTNCYRLINAEGDGLPGLIVDWYDGTAVLQTYSMGMLEARDRLLKSLEAVYGESLKAVYDKSEAVLSKGSISGKNQYLLGTASTGKVLEYGHAFWVDWETGQKTGFFLDQREHRRLLSQYAPGRRVLNTFSYSGGFSIYALKAGAALVHSVDSSTKAMDLTLQNIELNRLEDASHAAFTSDVFDFLKTSEADYEVIVLDPPAFAKNLAARHSAVMAYKRLNQLAIAKLKPGGILFTFSCSQVVSPDLFNGAVTAAAIEAGRPIRVLHHLRQPPDHPTNIFHPEGLYLKGLVVRVD